MNEDNWFEEVWHYRDNVVYTAELGGDAPRSIITIPYVAFAQMGAERIDPRWLHCGVLMFHPTATRNAFTFVTTGLSNAWDSRRPDPTSTSGLGFELRIDSSSDEHWAKDVLLRLSAMQLLIGAGRISGARLLRHGDRIKVGDGTFGDQSAMTGLLATKVGDFQLPSGTFEIIQLFAITDAEREFGAEALMATLRESTTYPVSDISRRSVA